MASKKQKSSSKLFKNTVKIEDVRALVNEVKKGQERLSGAAEALANSSSRNEAQINELISNMGSLMARLDKIFAIFEEASRHVGDVETAEGKITNLSTKLEALLEQNKSIAQGLILLEKYVRGKTRLEPAIQPKPLE